jgi:hypothetical protein
MGVATQNLWEILLMHESNLPWGVWRTGFEPMKDADTQASDKGAILLIDDEQPLLEVFKAAL